MKELDEDISHSGESDDLSKNASYRTLTILESLSFNNGTRSISPVSISCPSEYEFEGKSTIISLIIHSSKGLNRKPVS